VTQSYTKIGSFLHAVREKGAENLTRGLVQTYICPTIRHRRLASKQVINNKSRLALSRMQILSTIINRFSTGLSTTDPCDGPTAAPKMKMSPKTRERLPGRVRACEEKTTSAQMLGRSARREHANDA
jgi:hypothetical protein